MICFKEYCGLGPLFHRMKRLFKKMLVRLNKANLTTGMIGALYAAETAFTSGMNLVHLNCLTEAMAGFALFWMENWLPCTPVEALRVDQILLVGFWLNEILKYINPI